jgi:hypothetical protein
VSIDRYDNLILKRESDVEVSILRHYCGASRGTHRYMAQYIKTSTNYCVAGVVNAIFIFVTFLLSLPAMFLPTNRGWLRAQGWLVIVCATFTLGLGLAIWVETLEGLAHGLVHVGRKRLSGPTMQHTGKGQRRIMQSDADKV